MQEICDTQYIEILIMMYILMDEWMLWEDAEISSSNIPYSKPAIQSNL